MRILILHSELAPDAPDERGVMARVAAAEQALAALDHQVFCAPFRNDEADLREAIAWAAPQTIFNLAEIVDGVPANAHLAPRLFDLINIPYTGARPLALEAFQDRLKAKVLFRDHGLPTPSHVLPPGWEGMINTHAYIVKSLDRRNSFGLDDASVAVGWDIPDRLRRSETRHGGVWFAEAYMPGREFQVSLMSNIGGVHVLPIAELRFENWADHRARIVTYAARQDPKSTDARNTCSLFGWEKDEPDLAEKIGALSRNSWNAFGLTGYAQLDIRLDADGEPVLLSIQPNPSVAPDSAFTAAALRAGLSFPKLIERICEIA